MRVLAYAILVPLALFAAFPLVWIFATSLKTYTDVYSFPPHYIPRNVCFNFYRQVFSTLPFGRYILNSLLVSTISTALSVLFGSMSAWVFTRWKTRANRALVKFVLAAYLFPSILIVMPLFGLLNMLGLGGSYASLVICYVGLNYPLVTWLLIDYFQRLPIELEEQARIDGADNVTIFFRIVLPLAVPGLVTAAAFSFINAWNDFIYALTIVGAGDRQTLTLGLYGLVGGENAQWGPMMAATVIAMVPAFILFFIIQRGLVSGLTAGAVRG